jgi:hypothetical protein
MRILPSIVLAASLVLVPTVAHADAKPPVFKNCTAMTKVYPHGVGRVGAKDKHGKSSKAVMNFKVSTAIYKANAKRDGDKDGIACEKR